MGMKACFYRFRLEPGWAPLYAFDKPVLGSDVGLAPGVSVGETVGVIVGVDVGVGVGYPHPLNVNETAQLNPCAHPWNTQLVVFGEVRVGLRL